MTVPPDDLLLLSRQVAAALDDRITVHALTCTGDSGRAEVLVTISGCHAKPCLLLLNITRSDPDQVRQELTARLRRALEDHLGDHRHAPEPQQDPQTPSATRVLSESAATLDDVVLELEEAGAEAGRPVDDVTSLSRAREAVERATDAIEDTLLEGLAERESQKPDGSS